MVWSLADYADSATEQETSAFRSSLWILDSESKIVVWPLARSKDIKSYLRTGSLAGSPARIRGSGSSLAVRLVEHLEG